MRDGVVPFWIKSLAPLSPLFSPNPPTTWKRGRPGNLYLVVESTSLSRGITAAHCEVTQCKEEKKGNAPPNVSLKRGERRHSSSALFGVSSRKSSISIWFPMLFLMMMMMMMVVVVVVVVVVFFAFGVVQADISMHFLTLSTMVFWRKI